MQNDEHEPVSSVRDLSTYHQVHELTAKDDVEFRPERERSQCTREPVLILGNRSNMADDHNMNRDDDPDNDDRSYPPSPKRPRDDRDILLAEAVLAYKASFGNEDDAPPTYQQVMDSDDAKE